MIGNLKTETLVCNLIARKENVGAYNKVIEEIRRGQGGRKRTKTVLSTGREGLRNSSGSAAARATLTNPGLWGTSGQRP